MHLEREANGLVAVVWVSTSNRVLELRELLDEDGLLPEHVADSQAFAAGFVDRSSGERLPIPPAAVGRPETTAEKHRFMDWCAWTSRAHEYIDRHGRRALHALQREEALEARATPRRAYALA
jgi:hypothetical protein